MTNLFKDIDWQPPAHWQKITTVEMYTGGEPLRILTSGLPPIKGRTVLEKSHYFLEHYDHIRRGILWEPRCHADMYGAIITPSADADLDVFFLHNEGYSTMCGHAIIALTKFVFETGVVRNKEQQSKVVFNVPAGKVHPGAGVEKRKNLEASFSNLPSFLFLDHHPTYA